MQQPATNHHTKLFLALCTESFDGINVQFTLASSSFLSVIYKLSFPNKRERIKENVRGPFKLSDSPLVSSFYVLTTSHWDKWDCSDCLRWQWWGVSGEDREPNERTRYTRAVTDGCTFLDFVSSRHDENPTRDVREVAIGQDIWGCWQFCDLILNL